MEEAQEKDMDSVASFKSGKLLTITGRQYNVCSQNQMINLLVSSNRYGYIFYATEIDGLAIIPSLYIDHESRYLCKSSEDDDDDDGGNENLGKTSIIHRSYIPGQLMNKNPSFIPYWLSLNADETILAIVLSQLDTHSWLIILYDVVKLIQLPESTPLCPPIRLSSDVIGDTIQNFAWNPAISNVFAYIDGHGSVSSFEVDQNSKQLKSLGKSDGNDDNSSICWSPKGKQLVVVQYDGALELYEPNMKLKKKYPSATIHSSFPPCISVLWLSTHQFLLGFSENSPDENTNENSFFHIMVTYDKDQPPKTLIYNDLFFDASEAPIDINPQYFYVRLNESKTIISGLSKSLKINVLGPDELNQDSLNIWTFADQFRATVKGSTNVNSERPILTGMALGLNSTLSISEGNKKLPPCPILLLANSEGLLQIYYFIQKNLPAICRAPEVIKLIQVAAPLPPPISTPSLSSPLNSLQSFLPSLSSSNGFSFATSTTTTQSNGTNNTNTFNFKQQPLPTPTKSSIDDQPKSISSTIISNPVPVQQTPPKIITNNEQSSSSNNQKLLQTINEFQSRLKSLEKSLSKLSEPSNNLDKSLENLTTTLNNMTTSLQTSMQSIKSMTSEHIESMTKIEDARHQIKLSQKENLYHLLKDRELDPWTQSRLDLIKTKYDQLKHNLNVLLQLTHATIHDRSLSINDDETENEDFLPDLEISLNKNETMKQRIQKLIQELSHKVSETEKDLESICTKFNRDLLSSSTFTKTTMSSNRPFHASDAQLLSYLQATHPNVIQIHVPPAAVINLSSNIEQKKQSTIETTKPITPSIQPSTPKQTNSPIVESESYKNMLRIVHTSIDLFSGVTSPEQLQELSNTIARSPLSSTHNKSNVTSINKTPTIPKTSTTTRPLNTTIIPTNVIQTPAKSVTSPVPTISVTPATPATHAISSNTALKLQPNIPIVQTATDLSRAPTMPTSGDSAIRSLLNSTVSSTTTITSIPSQPIMTSTSNQVAKPILFGSTPTTSATQVISQSPVSVAITTTVATPVISTSSSTQPPFGAPLLPASTVTTSVQSTSPTTKPIVSTGFGSKPLFGSNALNLTSTTSSGASFGSSAITASTGSLFGSAATSTAPATTPFGSGFGATATSTAPATTSFGSGFGTTATTVSTSTPSTNSFGIATSPIPSPFGSGFATPTATAAPTTGIFGAATTSTSSPFGSGFGSATTTAATSSTPSTGGFLSGFGSNTTATSPFGGGFSTATPTSSASPFGGGFGTASSPSSGTTFGGFGGGVATTSTAPTSTSNTSGFGSSGFGFTSTLPATSSATSTTGSSPFGGGASTFGSGFSGFNTQSTSSGQPTGFSFSGFGSQPSDATQTQPSFSSFGSPPAVAQPSSPFGGSIFGGGGGAASGQPTGFGATTSSFGASSTQAAGSPSFTAYRK